MDKYRYSIQQGDEKVKLVSLPEFQLIQKKVDKLETEIEELFIRIRKQEVKNDAREKEEEYTKVGLVLPVNSPEAHEILEKQRKELRERIQKGPQSEESIQDQGSGGTVQG